MRRGPFDNGGTEIDVVGYLAGYGEHGVEADTDFRDPHNISKPATCISFGS